MFPSAADDTNPLESGSPLVWDRLIEAVGPAPLLVAIHGRMSEELRGASSAEDVLQETLLHAWRDRERFEWRGVASFRRWLLQIAENRLRDLRGYLDAKRRGGEKKTHPFSSLVPDAGASTVGSVYAGPIATTTPSRVATNRERAEAMRAALTALPPELEEVVRLRLFEDLPLEEVAQRVGTGVSGVRHRFRKGAALYQRKLTTELGTRGPG